MVKKTQIVRSTLLLLALSGVHACGGGGYNGGGAVGGINCAAISGGGTQATQSVQCTGAACSGNNKDAAIDNNLDTFATLQMGAGAVGSVRLRATAQEGIVYAAGTPAAVVYGIQRSQGTSQSTVETISTYLNGVLQETGNASSTNGVTSGDKPVGRRAMGTSMPFDAIEFSYDQAGGTATVEVQVYEFCTSVN